MTLIALDHLQLAMPEGGEADARAFYAELLGFREVPKPAPLADRGGCWFRGPLELHLGVEEDFRPAKKAHPAFRVADLNALAARLEAAGHALLWDDALPGVRRCYAHDPFGNRLEFLAAAHVGPHQDALR